MRRMKINECLFCESTKDSGQHYCHFCTETVKILISDINFLLKSLADPEESGDLRKLIVCGDADAKLRRKLVQVTIDVTNIANDFEFLIADAKRIMRKETLLSLGFVGDVVAIAANKVSKYVDIIYPLIEDRRALKSYLYKHETESIAAILIQACIDPYKKVQILRQIQRLANKKKLITEENINMADVVKIIAAAKEEILKV